jgi:hypothetical protein
MNSHNPYVGYYADNLTREDINRCVYGKPHKHVEIIKAWADGSQIEQRTLFTHAGNSNEWHDVRNPNWDSSNFDFRIKITPKPDTTTFLSYWKSGWSESPWSCYVRGSEKSIMLTYDGETGKLKSAEVL